LAIQTALAASPEAKVITFSIPRLRLRNPLNGSQGTTRVGNIIASKQRKAIRAAARLHTLQATGMNGQPIVALVGVRITRISPGTLDTDNLAAACKNVRDGVADALGINDAQAEGWWRYAQAKGAKGVYGVRVELLEVGDA
jgi:hypothetical protein